MLSGVVIYFGSVCLNNNCFSKFKVFETQYNCIVAIKRIKMT